jgi:proteasome lid subunit RPN8/RPN11
MLYITKSVVEQLISVVEMVPEESCGFLFGRIEGHNTKICKIMPVPNVSVESREVRYEIDGREFMVAERFAEAENLQLSGIYHTHLIDSAFPSEIDRRAAFPNLSYMIISLPNLRYSGMKVWSLNNDHQFEEEKFEIIN